MEGEISFSIRGERVAVLAPAYIDFILVSNRWSDIKTNAAFKGRLILSDKIFFKKTIDNIRFNFSEVIYWYAQKPFVSFGDEESKRMILLTDLLINIINKPDHHFCEEIQKDFLQTLQLDLWNIFSSYTRQVLAAKGMCGPICSAVFSIWCGLIAVNTMR